MSIQAINWALNVVTGISASEKAILFALADRANEQNCCFPSYDDICHRSCAQRRTVSRALRHFESIGLVTRQKRFGASTIYRLNITSSVHIAVTDKPISVQKHTTDECFELFWKAYPRKANRKTASLAWSSLSKKDKDTAMKALHTYEFSTEQKYIPHAATWIRQRRFEDESHQEETGTEFEL